MLLPAAGHELADAAAVACVPPVQCVFATDAQEASPPLAGEHPRTRK